MAVALAGAVVAVASVAAVPEETAAVVADQTQQRILMVLKYEAQLGELVADKWTRNQETKYIYILHRCSIYKSGIFQ